MSRSVEVSKALKQLSRAKASLKTGLAAAQTAGRDWQWLANDLRTAVEKLESIHEWAAKKAKEQHS